MKRNMKKKLRLDRELLRNLTGGDLPERQSFLLTDCGCTERYTSCLECFQHPPRPGTVYECTETTRCGSVGCP